MPPRVLVLGGAGALGRAVCTALTKSGMIPVSADFTSSAAARASIIVPANQSATDLSGALRAALSGAPALSGIVVTAGAWEGGGAGSPAFLSSWERLHSACLVPTLAGANLATSGLLAAGGLFVATGAAAALDAKSPPAGMLAYALVKGATHALIRGVGAAGGGLPEGARAIAIAPHTLDTAANRAAMPGADVSQWTPPDAIAEEISRWMHDQASAAAENAATPKSGSVVEVRTKSAGAHEWIVHA
jgi:NAD(P)-dependent dehydrogenase (short-subunit alcohol dehydrogenase family)